LQSIIFFNRSAGHLEAGVEHVFVSLHGRRSAGAAEVVDVDDDEERAVRLVEHALVGE
jgi:hypothetical protein